MVVSLFGVCFSECIIIAFFFEKLHVNYSYLIVISIGRKVFSLDWNYIYVLLLCCVFYSSMMLWCCDAFSTSLKKYKELLESISVDSKPGLHKNPFGHFLIYVNPPDFFFMRRIPKYYYLVNCFIYFFALLFMLNIFPICLIYWNVMITKSAQNQKSKGQIHNQSRANTDL